MFRFSVVTGFASKATSCTCFGFESRTSRFESFTFFYLGVSGTCRASCMSLPRRSQEDLIPKPEAPSQLNPKPLNPSKRLFPQSKPP